MGQDHFDVHSHVTNAIIAAMEAGAEAWQMPWHRSGLATGRPVNIASDKAYRGINVLSLWIAAEANGYQHGLWGTYRQWQAKGAQVRKGEKSSVIVFYKELERPRDDDPSETETVLFARASRVFNVAQVDGFEVPSPADGVALEDRINPTTAADELAAAAGATVCVQGDQAYYSPRDDRIVMPGRERFTGSATATPTEAWASTLLHELTHWSGAANRLDRNLTGRFGDEAYAMEELIAELGAAFLCADLDISTSPRADHAAYLAIWLKVLKADKKAIFTAASAASRAAEYLGNMQHRPDHTSTP
ncbi:zincin-like metallopeptidase domain-containing protein (plasmid) [Acuticoccus sp. MNP-M23]|uniref:ArdC family protein n=1 Tax=Acuticoccus sp. MNP-M23 TaxID=3072793 RepID=UPI002815400C|nr:zincin-like metallopeptidase domain-containing protein [Acuticoccus sp. MNP-M23]WMS45374.1 zincin-like metallopeptidase domain-containing protein [Acuticoccus sp. MNP-M23]